LPYLRLFSFRNKCFFSSKQCICRFPNDEAWNTSLSSQEYAQERHTQDDPTEAPKTWVFRSVRCVNFNTQITNNPSAGNCLKVSRSRAIDTRGSHGSRHCHRAAIFVEVQREHDPSRARSDPRGRNDADTTYLHWPCATNIIHSAPIHVPSTASHRVVLTRRARTPDVMPTGRMTVGRSTGWILFTLSLTTFLAWQNEERP